MPERIRKCKAPIHNPPVPREIQPIAAGFATFVRCIGPRAPATIEVMDGNTGLLRRTEPLAKRSKPWWVLLLVIATGVLVTVVAQMFFDGLDSGLPSGTLEEFNARVAEEGNDARYQVIVDLVGFIPGYVLVVAGLNLLVRRLPGLPRWFFRTSGIVLAVLTLAAILNVVADVVNLAVLGSGDLGSGTFEAAKAGRSLHGTLSSVFGAVLGIAILGTLLHVVVGLIMTVVQRVRRT